MQRHKGGENIKPIKCDLPTDLDSIELHALADFHIGDGMCDFKAIQAQLYSASPLATMRTAHIRASLAA